MATIRKRTLPSGLVRWQVDFTDQAGKRRSKLFPRRKDADVYLVKVRSLVANHTYLADSESITVAEAAKSWLEHCEVRQKTGRRMERATLRGYSDYVRLHITDQKVGIGDKLIVQLTRRHVNEFRDRLLINGRSEHLTRRALSVLKLILDHAIDNGQLFTNAAQGVRVIKSSRIDHMAPVPSKEAIRALIEAADEDFKPHLIVSALGGLRASELRGLRWQDVDFEAGFIRIRQRADAYNEIGEPKSKAGFRDIPAGPMVLNALRHWKLRCPKSELGLVFPAPRGGILQHTNTQTRFRRPLQGGRREDALARSAPLRRVALDRAGLLDQGDHDLRRPRLRTDDHGALRAPVPVARPPEGHGPGRGAAARLSGFPIVPNGLRLLRATRRRRREPENLLRHRNYKEKRTLPVALIT
jgi:integrase